ncbi:hypothetical protein [Aquabacterium sp.]|uniref:hypothetical protein n=1 Tax=Aquabacterium sp. TaxID=1872578 RepID=UPI002BA5C51A|nr:hypothetical protein [Aquabacterium sp.]HSW06872.1 hypothetical protein [Aquabacterium sp.]
MSQDSIPPAAGFGWPWTVSWPMPGGGSAPQFTFAPERLWQPINPGWSFGNLIVNQQNSSAPEVEQAVVSQVSYGKQIGKLIDAIEVLIEAAPAVSKVPAIEEFGKLVDKIKDIKKASMHQRLDRLREELEALKAHDQSAWQQLAAALK